MISCDAPVQKLNYIFSCHLLAQVQIKIGRLEGSRQKPTYADLLENPLLNYSGVLQHSDFYITAQIFANNTPLCLPVKTSYKYMEPASTTGWLWDEWLTMPLKISDLPRNALLAVTVWDLESAQRGDVAVCGGTLALFDKFGEFRQGCLEMRMWPRRIADGSVKTSTPAILSDCGVVELASEDLVVDLETNNNNTNTTNVLDEGFPILDELDRLAKMSKIHSQGHMIKHDWLDRLTLKEIQNSTRKAKMTSSNDFMYMNVELAQIKCEDVKYIVLYYEEDTDRCLQTLPSNELFVVNDPELELDNIIELKNRKLEHSKQMGVADMHLKPDTDNKSLLTKIVNYPVTRALKREEQALMWKYRYYLTQNKKALTKFLQCFDLNLEFEGKMLMELMLKWQPMDVEDALELLGSKYKAYPKIRSYAVSRLTLASNHDLILYLLQLVQALRYETFSPTQQRIKSNESTQNNTNNKSQSRKGSLSSSQASVAATTPLQDNNNQLLIDQQQQQQDNNVKSLSKRTFELNLRTFLLERATQNEVVALSLYWFVKVEIKDTKTTLPSAANTTTTTIPSTATTSTTDVLTNSSSTTTIINTISSNSLHSAGQPDSTPPPHPPPPSSSSSSSSAEQHSNFHIFMSELLDSLRNGNQYARNTYDNIINQEKFLKALNDVVKSTIKESGGRDQKVTKLRQFMADTAASSSNFDLVNFPLDIPLISDPAVKINATQIEKTTMFKSALMPCKFCFKTTTQEDEEEEETTTTYSVIYKIGDDLRQDQLVLQMIALMDKLLKQENLDLKLTPYKVVATGIKEGFLQFVDAMPMSEILKEYRSIKEYLKRHNPGSDQQPQDKYGMTADAMDNYVRSTAGYMVITYILGVGDRHYDNILITKCGKIVHIDFGYILGREPKPFQPIVKWTKDMADGMGGKYGPDGKENKEYEDFKKYCYNAFLHLRRHANLILNLFSLMVDANIPDIALEPDKTVKKLIDRFKLDVSDEQASGALLKEIENNYDTIVGSITDIIHGYAVAQK